MASPAHALYCFEVLNASLKNQKALSLSQVEAYHEEYVTSQEELTAHATLTQDTAAGLDETHSDEARSTNSNPHLVPQSTSSTSTPISTNSAASYSIASSRTTQSSDLSAEHSPKKQPPSHPMFITWNIHDHHKTKSLRGCIGTFESQPLETGLHSYALTSAFEDTRFAPITLSEFPHLDCSVTLLTDFETAPDPKAWDIGKHGLRISFQDKGRRYSATYLPDVAMEQGWTKEETMVSLMRKAGWNGRRSEWSGVGDLRVVRYQGLKVQVGSEEWRAWREWVDAHSGVSR